jgi:YVTN family beta-propeller protein
MLVWTKRHTLVAGSAIALAAAAGLAVGLTGGSPAHLAAATHAVTKSANGTVSSAGTAGKSDSTGANSGGTPTRPVGSAGNAPGTFTPAGTTKADSLTAATCSGPAGTAYIAEPGYSAFDGINTADCKFIQDYNVDDPQVPGDPGDYNYSSSPQDVALHGSTLYITDTAQNNVSVIDAATLTKSDYNPAEIDIHVGFDPTGLAVTPDGSQVWVADSGPQTDSGLTGISVISASTNTVTATLQLPASPQQIAFSPSGATAYVTTSDGLWIYSTSTDQVTGVVRGLGALHGVIVSPDGGTVYVTSTDQNVVDVISTSGYPRVTSRIAVGDLPWGVALSANGGTLYVADPDSNQISVIDTATGAVTNTLTLAGGPDVLALTPDGSQLWVTGITSADITVISTSTGAVIGTTNLGGEGANSGDGNDPSGIVMSTATVSGAP